MTGATITYLRDQGYIDSGAFVVLDQDYAARVEFSLSKYGPGAQMSASTCDFRSYGPVSLSDQQLLDILVSIQKRRPDLWARVGQDDIPRASDITEEFLD